MPSGLLPELLPQEIFAYLLVFCRVGAAMTVLPGVGEAFVSPRFRLLLALVIAVVMTPPLADRLPGLPSTPLELALLIAGEMVYGFFIGTVARFLISALVMAGTIISFLSGFSAAQLFNPMLADQGALSAVFLSLAGLLIVFATDTHHLLFRAIAESYDLFVPGRAPDLADMADMLSQVMARSFTLAMQLAAPFIVVAVMFYTGLGLIARLMPQMPVFFVILPLQIVFGLFILFLSVTGILMWFLDRFEGSLTTFFVPL